MSSMRSASSSTRISRCDRSTVFCCMWSSRRPGVATTISTPLAQRVDLRIDADAAEDHRRLQLQVLAVRPHAFFDLRGQFARGREDQRAHRALAEPWSRPAWCSGAAGRQREAGGLAGAGLGAAEHVAALQHGGNGRAWMGVGVS